MPDDLPGLDLGALASWFGTGPLTGRLLAGGLSNLTYVVTDGSSEWVVRRPPLGHVLATAHDMTREHRVIHALRDSAVPVPAVHGLCEDPEVIGAPFYVMELVVGATYAHVGELEAIGADRTRAVVDRLVDTLADLHAVDPEEVGLGDFGRPQGFLGRQVRRWRKQLDSSHSREVAGIEELHARLEAAVPEERGSAAVVHGDYRLDNALVGADDRVAAVLDWEMATLADPLTDVATMSVYHRLGRIADAAGAFDVSLAPGFPTEGEVFERYAARSGRDLDDLGFHLGLASFKLAVILEGINYRHVHGQTVGPGFEQVGSLVEPLVAAGLSALTEEHS